MTKVTTTPNVTLAQNLERSAYTALATGAALLIADGAAKGVTHISVANYKAAGVAALAGLLNGLKNIVVNYLSNHQSLKAQLAALQAQVNAQAEAQKPTASPVTFTLQA